MVTKMVCGEELNKKRQLMVVHYSKYGGQLTDQIWLTRTVSEVKIIISDVIELFSCIRCFYTRITGNSRGKWAVKTSQLAKF